MRKIYLLILMSFFLHNCKENTDLKPNYSDFENDLEQRNLYGKVKELEQYKAIFQNGEDTRDPLLNLREKFTEFGSLNKAEYFDNYGKITQIDHFYYDDNHFLKKSISENNLANQKTVQLISYDSIKKTTTRNITFNDSLNYKFISTFDSNDLIAKQIKIEAKDTVVRSYEYKFNDDNKKTLEKEFEEGKELSIGTYKYDKENQLIEYSNKEEWMELLTQTEWKNNRIFKQTDYTISADLKKYLDRITEYDRQFNPVNIKIYENSELNRELEYDYEFDQFGNWIKRTVSMKEHFANSNKFIPIYIESREIKYWE
ncbi:hypothetical protein ACG2LH_01950 [Zhouia sp. PK063]|uniref:hypothetical protein n=1 Tax=Zhouia sp. PK063 TaxID=3373602 RepID=UPI00378BFC09